MPVFAVSSAAISRGMARGVEVRVRETVGESGDIYIMHPAMLHTIAPNALDQPRMMLAQTLAKFSLAESSMPEGG
jgi:hypothetical protein